MEENLRLFLNVKCPFCGSALEMIEDDRHIVIRCPECRRYIKVSKRYFLRNYIDYNDGNVEVNWSEFIRDIYLMVRIQSRRESSRC